MADRLYWWWYGVWDRFGGPLKRTEFRWNHPAYWQIVVGEPMTQPETRSERLCVFLDAISSNWFHD